MRGNDHVYLCVCDCVCYPGLVLSCREGGRELRSGERRQGNRHLGDRAGKGRIKGQPQQRKGPSLRVRVCLCFSWVCGSSAK